MDILDIIINKTDENGIKRISKTKIISLMVFIVSFLFAMSIYISEPKFIQNIALSLFSAILFGLIVAVPVFILGWIVSKFLNRDKTSSDNTLPQEYASYNNQTVDFIPDAPCPQDNASKFKNAINNNDSELAEKILSSWDVNDANYVYAKIIFEGMPPTNVGLEELNCWLEKADSMKSCDGNLRLWFRNTAVKVINMH